MTVKFRAMQDSVERIGSDCMICLLSGLWTPSDTPNRTQRFGKSIYFGVRLIEWWLTCVDSALYGTFRIRCARLQDANFRVVLSVNCCIYVCPIVIRYIATSISIPALLSPICFRQIYFVVMYNYKCRSHWMHDLRRRSAAARLLKSWVRIPPAALMTVCCQQRQR